MRWVSGTNDFAFPLLAEELHGTRRVVFPLYPKQYEARTERRRGARGNPCFRRFDSTQRETTKNRIELTYQSEIPVDSAELLFTKNQQGWKERRWLSVPAEMNGKSKVSATILEGTKAFFLTLKDPRGFVTSSPHPERD